MCAGEEVEYMLTWTTREAGLGGGTREARPLDAAAGVLMTGPAEAVLLRLRAVGVTLGIGDSVTYPCLETDGRVCQCAFTFSAPDPGATQV